MSKERVETFSDGVFAIVLTLLVLNLTVPTISAHSDFNGYIAALIPVIPKLIAFILTFLIIALHWVSHHYFFARIKTVTLGLIWLNIIFLLWISLMPFPAALLGAHITDEFPIFLMGVSQLLASLTFLLFRYYATRQKLFVQNAIGMGPKRTLPAITLYSLTIIFSFVNVYLALIFLILAPLIYLIPNFLDRKFS